MRWRGLVAISVVLLTVPVWSQVFRNPNDPTLQTPAPVVAFAVPTAAATYDAGTAATLAISGTATTTAGVSICTWANSQGGSGTATTAASGAWSVAAVPLAVSSSNAITVTCLNPQNIPGVTVLTVTRSGSGTDPCLGATNCYYIDITTGNDGNSTSQAKSKATPWKHVPGMANASSTAAGYSAAGGDVFVFKGGETWTSATYPWTFRSGSSSMITYASDPTWYSGGSFVKPIFDAQSAFSSTTTGMANLTGAGYVTLDRLQFRNCGTQSASEGAKCLIFTNTHDITINATDFSTKSWINVYFPFVSSGTYANFRFTNNTCTLTTGCMWFASATGNVVMQNLYYVGNTVHDFAPMIGGGAHGDGFLHYFNSPSNDATQYLDGFTFCNNYSYGDFSRGISGGTNEDMTGLLYQEGAIKNGLICNNEFTWSPAVNASGGAAIFEAIINLRDRDNAANTTMQVYNNSIGGDPTAASGSAAILLQSGGEATIRNNIITFGTYCGYGEDGTPSSLTRDHNEYTCPNGFLTFGSEGAGSLGPPSDPKWLTNYTNLHLTGLSPGIDAGVNLTSLGVALLLSDKDGVARPSGVAAWDLGAYQRVP